MRLVVMAAEGEGRRSVREGRRKKRKQTQHVSSGWAPLGQRRYRSKGTGRVQQADT